MTATTRAPSRRADRADRARSRTDHPTARPAPAITGLATVTPLPLERGRTADRTTDRMADRMADRLAGRLAVRQPAGRRSRSFVAISS